MQKNKLKFWGIFCIILAVALGVITLVYRWHRVFPTGEVSEIYATYAGIEGVEASFVKNYRVNDSVTVDVTVLEAKSDTAWTMLKDDYGVPPLSSKSKSDIEKGSPCIVFCKLPELIKNDNRSSEKYTNDNTLVVAMHNDSTIYVFYSKTRERKDAIMDMFIDNYFGL